MKVMTVSEFLDWDRRSRPEEYIYATVNQNGDGLGPDLRFVLRFSQATIRPELRQLFFKAGRSSLQIDGVKEVHMDEMTGFAAVLEVICFGEEDNPHRFLIF